MRVEGGREVAGVSRETRREGERRRLWRCCQTAEGSKGKWRKRRGGEKVFGVQDNCVISINALTFWNDGSVVWS